MGGEKLLFILGSGNSTQGSLQSNQWNYGQYFMDISLHPFNILLICWVTVRLTRGELRGPDRPVIMASQRGGYVKVIAIFFIVGQLSFVMSPKQHIGMYLRIPSRDILSPKSKNSTGFDVRPTLWLDYDCIFILFCPYFHWFHCKTISEAIAIILCKGYGKIILGYQPIHSLQIL